MIQYFQLQFPRIVLLYLSNNDKITLLRYWLFLKCQQQMFGSIHYLQKALKQIYEFYLLLFFFFIFNISICNLQNLQKSYFLFHQKEQAINSVPDYQLPSLKVMEYKLLHNYFPVKYPYAYFNTISKLLNNTNASGSEKIVFLIFLLLKSMPL